MSLRTLRLLDRRRAPRLLHQAGRGCAGALAGKPLATSHRVVLAFGLKVSHERRRHMNGQSQDLKELLLQTDEEFHQLAAKHHELEGRLNELTAKHYLSGPEQLEESTLKKRKLQIKDRMEYIIRRHRDNNL